MHARQVLQVVAAQQPDDPAHRHRAVAFEEGGPRELLVVEAPDPIDRRAARLAKSGQRRGGIGIAIAALLGERISIERRQMRPRCGVPLAIASTMPTPTAE